MGKREFTCEHCRGTFEKDWSDEEAMAEMQLDFGDVPAEHRAEVCHDCYELVMAIRGGQNPGGWVLRRCPADGCSNVGVVHVTWAGWCCWQHVDWKPEDDQRGTAEDR